ncbi:MAG TPA: GNAT family N-acetyltransferase [Actinomycetota bacterium]|nr:GNAT family N-acetyltransferase [Actinomycetota bacterium]
MTDEPEDLALWCDARTFTPVRDHPVRWLDWEKDFELAVELDNSVSLESWLNVRDQGFVYCAVVKGDRALARAALWTYSESRWEVAAVRTREECRGRGMAKSVVSFVTAHILAAGRAPTLHTQPTNLAMLRAAKAVGFQLIDADPARDGA